MILDRTVLQKFHPPEAVGSGIFDCFPYNFRTEVDIDVISGMAVDNVGMYVHVEFGDSRSNGFRDIRGAHFVSDERTNQRTLAKAYPNSAKRCVSLKRNQPLTIVTML